MFNRSRMCLTAVIVLGLSQTAAAVVVPILKDGGFESPVAPQHSYTSFSTGSKFSKWTVTGTGNVAVIGASFTYLGYSLPPKSGAQWLDLTGTSNTASGIRQTVPTTSGATYTLSFYVGNAVDPNSNIGTSSTVKVSINGSKTNATNSSGADHTIVWKRFSRTFVATSAATTIAFVNGDPSTDTLNGLDGVSITQTAP